jgi:hypothetical protein
LGVFVAVPDFQQQEQQQQHANNARVYGWMDACMLSVVLGPKRRGLCEENILLITIIESSVS